MSSYINGIQHIGVGVPDSELSQQWYRKYFGMDIRLFDGTAPASLMNRYTNEEALVKRASMVMNLKGGCAFEIIEPKSKPCKYPVEINKLGDLGIFIVQIKTPDIDKAHDYLLKEGTIQVSGLMTTPDQLKSFYLQDPNGFYFQVIEDSEFFSKLKYPTAGCSGVQIGISEMEKSLAFYQNILGFNELIYDEKGSFEDLSFLPDGDKIYRRVKLKQSGDLKGGFAKLTGKTSIELIQAVDRKAIPLFQDRNWGDAGFLHLGLDVYNMKELEKSLNDHGLAFTCNSEDVLEMGGNTKVHCTYIEDPDGTLIELIEVYKIAISEKWGLFLDLKNRKQHSTLPSWVLKALRFGRIAD